VVTVILEPIQSYIRTKKDSPITENITPIRHLCSNNVYKTIQQLNASMSPDRDTCIGIRPIQIR
jgi:hypothetical protein